MCRRLMSEATHQTSQNIVMYSGILTSCKVNVLDNLCEVVQQPKLDIHILGDICFALQGILDASQTLVHILCVRFHCFCEPFLFLV